MKNLNYLNYFFVGLPITLCLLGFIDGSFMYFGLLFMICTGFFQVLVGIKLLVDEPKNWCLRTYLISVVLFFSLAFFGYQNQQFIYILYSIPPLLAIYLSILIYKKANPWTH